jgi:hypothetical protein
MSRIHRSSTVPVFKGYSNSTLGKEITMIKCLVVILLPFVFYACDSSDLWEDDFRAEETESRIFSSSEIHAVKMETKNGGIRSSVRESDSIHVRFEKWATGDDREEARDNMRDIRIHTSKGNTSGVLSIDVDFPNRIGTNYGCNVYLDVPQSLFLDLESSNGAITVSESRNGLECSTSNGAIAIQDTEGKVELKTSNGAITVKDHYGELNGRTSNGAIDADVILPRRAECILKTSNGSITLSIPSTTSAMIEASTSSGKVEVQNLDVTIVKTGKTEIKGKIGNGEGDIDLGTSNGAILIRRAF